MSEPYSRRFLLSTALAGTAALLTPLAWRWSGEVRREGFGSPTLAIADEVCIVAPLLAWDPASKASPLAAREVPEQARCPVCGMYPARQRRWAAQLIFADGHAHFLDSPLSLFHYLQRVPRYANGRQRSEIAAMYVSDVESGAWIPARQAFFVHGSSQLGPMRSGNLPALATASQARQFASRYGGEVLDFASLQSALPPDLKVLAPHRH